MNAILNAARRLVSLLMPRDRGYQPVGTVATPPNARSRRGRQVHGADAASQSQPHPTTYLGDWRGALPDSAVNAWDGKRDGEAAPGEIAWAWVPFEEDYSQGKDRPVLLLCEAPGQPDVLLALPLTSKDHDRDAAQEAREGRLWMDIGSGTWDQRGRRSEVRINRVLQLRRHDIRREGAVVDRNEFAAIVAAATEAMR